ncbi:MAG: peptide chain release factor N(5)-glutamine methyltransferase [Lachnospiraceae bacterium]|nr:peptide chain release factor N(5)-glutamine methyltransferase [Lachnospiraceae bacterium]
MKLKELRSEGVRLLEQAAVVNAAYDARILLEYTLRENIDYLLLHGDDGIGKEDEDRYLKYINRRALHEPLQYITGYQEFMGLKFCVDKEVLIPRQDTECLVEEAMIEIQDNMRVLDVCTGSGCIIISLAKYKNGLYAVGSDISDGALETARSNALLNEADVKFVKGDIFSGLHNLESPFDVIISNPPYIRSKEISTLMEEVRDHEPVLALDGGEDGLDFYRRILEETDKYLLPGGIILFETGFDQGIEVASLLKEKGFINIDIIKDLNGLDRVVKGRRAILKGSKD